MSSDTNIEWADDTTSPWWGCSKVSPACTHCYAEGVSARFRRGSWGLTGERALRVDACLADLARFARRGVREGRPRRVFLGSMCDVFEDRPDLVEPRKRLWTGLRDVGTRHGSGIRALVLTKRPEHMVAWAAEHGWPGICWAGATVEDQQRADERIPYLLRVPARVRFLSVEPALGPVKVGPAIAATGHPDTDYDPAINWVIVGGESGPHARPSHPDWFRSLRDQCQSAGVPFFFKQWGEWAPIAQTTTPDNGRPNSVGAEVGERVEAVRVGKHTAGRLLDGRTWDEMPDAD